MTLTIELPDDLYVRLNAVPEGERNNFAVALFREKLASKSDNAQEESAVTPAPHDNRRSEWRQEAKARSRAFAALRQQWASEPDNADEPTLEELMEGVNQNRRANGERLIY